MTKRQENKLTMYEGVLSFLSSNARMISTVPVLKDSAAGFNTVVISLRSKSLEVGNVSTGKTAVKSQAEDNLLTALLPIASGLFVIARKQNNAELKEKVRVSERTLMRMRDTELASKGELIASLANQQLSNLTPASITDTMIADLSAKVIAYRDAIGARESGVAERIGARTSMEDLFIKADGILEEEIDPGMELLRGSQTELYNEYFSARVIKDLGIRHRPEQATAPATAPAAVK